MCVVNCSLLRKRFFFDLFLIEMIVNVSPTNGLITNENCRQKNLAKPKNFLI